MDIQFKEITVADLSELKALSIQTFKAAFESKNDPLDFQNYLATAFSDVQLHKELQTTNSYFYFIKAQDKTVGYIKLNCEDAQNELKEANGTELERIYVLPSYQGKGIGAKALQWAEQQTKTWNKSYLWLGVWEENTSAIKFYERHGYRTFGKHPYFVGSDEQTDWLLKKTLQ